MRRGGRGEERPLCRGCCCCLPLSMGRDVLLVLKVDRARGDRVSKRSLALLVLEEGDEAGVVQVKRVLLVGRGCLVHLGMNRGQSRGGLVVVGLVRGEQSVVRVERHVILNVGRMDANIFAVFIVVVLSLASGDRNQFELTRENHRKRFGADGLVRTGHPRTIAPLVDFAAKGLCFVLELTELTGGQDAVATRGVDVGDGRINDAGLGGSTDLGQVGKQGCKVEEAAVEGLAALAFDGIVGRPALGSVGPAGRLALGLLRLLGVGGCRWLRSRGRGAAGRLGRVVGGRGWGGAVVDGVEGESHGHEVIAINKSSGCLCGLGE